MMTETSTDKTQESSWLDKLSQVLLREPKDRQQLIELLRDAEQRSLLDADALSMIEGVMQVADMQVRDIMIPRAQMIVVNEDDPLEAFLPTVIESKHSRFPVLSANRDEVVGILLAKDLLQFTQADKTFNMDDVIRPATFVPESKHLNVLLKEFRVTRNHMAIVVDEYGSMAGFVTIEDVLEQIVGEIEDEYDVDEDVYIKKHSDGIFIVKASMPIEEFNQYFTLQYSDEEFDTIGGLVVQAFGHLPKRGEQATLQNFSVEVLNADNRRIHLLKLTRK
jgi:magnesium and cobalt transporter